MKECSCVTLVGCRISWTAWFVFAATWMHPGVTICPRYSSRSFRKKHFPSLSVRPPYLSTERTVFRWFMWPSIFYKIMMSSRHTISNFHRTELSRISIAHWNVPGAFVNAKGLCTKRISPCCDMNAVLSRSWSSIVVCQYSELQSRMLNILASEIDSIHSSIRAIG